MPRIFLSEIFKSLFIPLVCVCLLFASLAYADAEEPFIRFNQVGYSPAASKVAIVSAGKEDFFELLDANDERVVYRAKLAEPALWEYSKERVQKADFSDFSVSGEFYLRVAGTLSMPFKISDNVFDELHRASIESFYLNRSGIEIERKYAGEFSRRLGHPDDDVKVHKSAVGPERKEGSIISAPRGWYDAGDYGKYIVNSGISTYTLLLAYQHFSDTYKQLTLSIPESDEVISDLLYEIKWNLDWMESMQDTDGGVYHKLTALTFSKLDARPYQDTQQRWVIGKSVTAALDFAAVMATASRVMQPYDSEFKGVSQRYKDRAVRAYKWAKSNPGSTYQQPKDVATGAYGDDTVADEFAWAAAELFLLTGESLYWDDFLVQSIDSLEHLNWRNVSVLPFISLTSFGKNALKTVEYRLVEKSLLSAANALLEEHQSSAYNVAMSQADFQWGSNSSALNNGLVLFQAFRATGDHKYRTAALATLDYVLGTNATGYSFVTGYGSKTPQHIHHRPSVADDIENPIPGFLAGGPHTGRQDKCEYVGDLPATNYADTECSYSTNEIAINWNAPLVYILGAAVSTTE